MKSVEVYDLQTKQLSTIPITELAPGMVKMHVLGVGSVWVMRAGQPKPMTKIFHPPFDAELRKLVETKIMQPLAEVQPKTLDQWEDGFRRDLNAEQEIAVWIVIAQRFSAFIKGNLLNKQQRREAFYLMLHCTMVPDRESLWATFHLQRLTRKQAEEAIAPFAKNWRK